ncbi:short-chain dehydrogenase/reductase [Diaporthe helianthi]|uniref:Short-chain dehydrogenase/reductase n=1 Tax=Diaporthe helianthi TaxID=158607 RepID=A0A2P5HVC3_DIAHE|nr:short-chain dehydrogenase/reductase [Diaporthe helianthi]
MSSLWAQFWAARQPPADPTDSYSNMAVLVTGANSGLGHEAAVKCDPDIFSVETVELASFASVKALADRINAGTQPLHVAQLAAGVAQWKYEKSPDEYEMTLQVNVLYQALLALLLLPKLRAAAAAAATASSEDGFVPHLSFLHSIAGFEVDPAWLPPGQSLIQRCNDQSKWDATKQYYLTKLALWEVVEGLADRCKNETEGQAIIVNATCPSGCKKNMGRNFPALVRPILALQHFVCGRTAEFGTGSSNPRGSNGAGSREPRQALEER